MSWDRLQSRACKCNRIAHMPRSCLALTSAGQLFIVHTIKSYGALLFATVMTTRQFLSILLSCILYRHPLTAGQWCAAAFQCTRSSRSCNSTELR